MSIQIEQQEDRQNTVKTTMQCAACGWWDMSMKYGPSTRCTRCGNPLTGTAAPDPPAPVN